MTTHTSRRRLGRRRSLRDPSAGLTIGTVRRLVHLSPVVGVIDGDGVELILGCTSGGTPVSLKARTTGFLDDLESAIQAARAAWIIRGAPAPAGEVPDAAAR